MPASTPEGATSSERAKAFIDATVAIAMTLLILPLMESVGELREAEGALGWLAEHRSQLMVFVLSFVIIATLWLSHHRLFATVEHVTAPLMARVLVWVLTIVWLPVATALIGAADGDDPVAKALYVGTLVVTCLASLAVRLHLRAHPELHDIDAVQVRAGIAADVAMAALYALALAVSILVPAIGYFALFTLVLTRPLQRLLLLVARPRTA